MVKYLKYLIFLLPFLLIPTINVQADEIVDMSTWVDISGRTDSDNVLQYSSEKVYNDEVFLNPYNVFSGIEFAAGNDYFIKNSFFERNRDVWSPCNQASFTISFWVLFTDQHSFVNHVRQIRFNDSVCDLTSRDGNSGRVYATCVVPHKSDRWNDIFIDYEEFFEYPSKTSSIYISRYNRLTCALDTQSIITNDNANTQNIINNNNQNTQNIINSQNQTTDAVNSLNDTLNSESNPDTNDYLQDFQDSLASDTPITNLLTLPLTLINAYNNGITSNCSPVNLGNLYGTDIVFPCLNLEQRLGTNLWTIIDSLCSIFLIYSIAMLFVHAFDNFTSLKDDFDGMYVPRHAGKHVGSGVDG